MHFNIGFQINKGQNARKSNPLPTQHNQTVASKRKTEHVIPLGSANRNNIHFRNNESYIKQFIPKSLQDFVNAHTKHWANMLPLTSVLNSGVIQFSPTSAAANSMHEFVFKLYRNIAYIQWHLHFIMQRQYKNTVYTAVWLRSENKTHISIIHKTAFCLQLRVFQLISHTHNK
jgi:hypothetical protein